MYYIILYYYYIIQYCKYLVFGRENSIFILVQLLIYWHVPMLNHCEVLFLEENMIKLLLIVQKKNVKVT